jgi:hypothetical protein
MGYKKKVKKAIKKIDKHGGGLAASMGLGAVGGAGVAAAVGSIGVAAMGTAVAVTAAPVIAAGAVVGAAGYGVAKAFEKD